MVSRQQDEVLAAMPTRPARGRPASPVDGFYKGRMAATIE